MADIVWSRFGDVTNYVEPFFGSGAVLLGRPATHTGDTETINDKDGFVANVWRAIQSDPEAVAKWADNPVNEVDLHARHCWLVDRRETLTARLMGDPDYHDAKIAGWWLWGIACWIGSGWCSGEGPWWPVEDDEGHKQLVHLGDKGRGVNKKRVLSEWMTALSDRLRRVRVCSGDWLRVCGPAVTFKRGMAGVFLDPPYSAEAGRDEALYAEEDLSVAHEVRRWCIENQDNPLLRIALCGYEGEHDLPGWTEIPWRTVGGFGSQGNTTGRENAARERIWFSPACIDPARWLL